METTFIEQDTAYCIAEKCPRSLGAYLTCLRHVDDDYCYFSRDFIVNDMGLSWTRFKNDVRDLSKACLLEFKMFNQGEPGEGIQIILADNNF